MVKEVFCLEVSLRKILVQISKYSFLIGRHSNFDRFFEFCHYTEKIDFSARNFFSMYIIFV
jgi:hypothetical protein